MVFQIIFYFILVTYCFLFACGHTYICIHIQMYKSLCTYKWYFYFKRENKIWFCLYNLLLFWNNGWQNDKNSFQWQLSCYNLHICINLYGHNIELFVNIEYLCNKNKEHLCLECTTYKERSLIYFLSFLSFCMITKWLEI